MLNTTAEFVYDSNVFAREDSESDLYFSLIPELQFLRRAGRGTIDARAGVNVTRFLDLQGEDFEDLHAGLDVTYPVSPDSPLSGGVSIGYTELTEAHDFLNERVTSEEFAAGAKTLYAFSDRLGLRNLLSYEDVTVDGFSGYQRISASAGLQWFYSEKLSFFTDYRLRKVESDGEDTIQGREIDNLDNSIHVGAIGTLRPRIQGVASIGVQKTTSRADEPDATLIVASAALDWQWRPLTKLRLDVSRELDVAPTDETVEASDVTLGVEHDLDEKIMLNGYIGYRNLNFRSSDRKENALLAGAGLEYTFTRYWNAGASFDLTFNNSTVERTEYDRQVVRLYTRYTF